MYGGYSSLHSNHSQFHFCPEIATRSVAGTIRPYHQAEKFAGVDPGSNAVAGGGLAEDVDEPGSFGPVVCGDAAEDEDPEKGDAGLRVAPGGGEVGDLENVLDELGELAQGSALVGEGEDDADAVDEGRETTGFVDDFVRLVGGKPVELAGRGEGEEGILGEVALIGDEGVVGVDEVGFDVLFDEPHVEMHGV